MSGAVDEVGGTLERRRSRRGRLLHGRRPGAACSPRSGRTRCEPSCPSTARCRGRVPSLTTRALSGAVLGHYAGKDEWASPEVGKGARAHAA